MHGLIIVKNHTKKHARAKLYNFTKHGVPKNECNHETSVANSEYAQDYINTT
jgi:hypothetical protein